MGKRESPKIEWYTGVSLLVAFTLDHMQSVMLILSPKNSTILTFIMGGPISYYPRAQREEVRKQGQKMGNRESPKIE